MNSTRMYSGIVMPMIRVERLVNNRACLSSLVTPRRFLQQQLFNNQIKVINTPSSSHLRSISSLSNHQTLGQQQGQQQKQSGVRIGSVSNLLIDKRKKCTSNYVVNKEATSHTNMTNKPRSVLHQHNSNHQLNTVVKSKQLHTNGKTKDSTTSEPYILPNSLHFQNMASVQKLAIEPTREHIENIRHMFMNYNAKNNHDQQITLDKDDKTGIGTICIKSAAKNGISAKMMCDLLDIIDELYNWPEGKGVMIYGHGGFFCSGGDLVSVRELANYEDGLRMATLMQYNLARLQALPMITMALIQGRALGGGAEIAVATDLRAITRSARLGYVHSRVGIVAAWGGGSRLVQLVGPSRAVELMSSGRLVDAEEALSFGLVNQILDDANLSEEQILNEARKYLKQHCNGAKTTIMAIKGLVNAARTMPLEQALVAECQILSSIWGKPPHIEALNNNVKHRDG